MSCNYIMKLCEFLDCDNCANRRFSSSPFAKLWSDKNPTTPDKVTISSNIKRIFNCNYCMHESMIIPKNITASGNSRCKYCTNQALCDDNNCNICYQKSFSVHPKSHLWSDKNPVSTRQVFRNSSKKYWFNCDQCPHEIEVKLNSIRGDTINCEYCASKLLCKDQACRVCYEKSFMSHTKSIYFSPKNNVSPRDVFLHSGKNYIFNCAECLHEFTMILDTISKGCWCAYCSGHKRCLSPSCIFCFNKSFASHERSKYWSKTKNNISPREVSLNNHTDKFWFKCEVCKFDFDSLVRNVCNGTWCPFCKNKTEAKLLNWLRTHYSHIHIQPQAKYDWCKSTTTSRFLPFDFSFEKIKLIMELDGDQHFRQISTWKSPEETQTIDIYKMHKALEQGYSIIRILQDDVWNNRNNWEQNLKEAINLYDTPQIVFICENNEYDVYEQQLESNGKSEI